LFISCAFVGSLYKKLNGAVFRTQILQCTVPKLLFCVAQKDIVIY